jgi:predicted dienelactone hydrolase
MRRISVVVALLLTFACASNSAPKAAPATFEKSTGYSVQPGKEAVGVVPAATIHDPQRNRDVELSIDYPIKGGPYPLIILSHAYGASEQSYEQLASYWTSNGYAVIRPRHADAGKGPDAMRAIFGEQTNAERERQQRGRRPSRQEFEKAAAAREDAERRQIARTWETQREPQWRDRVRDVSLVIDNLDDLEQRFFELKGKFDHSKIGVAGHDLGALTAMLAGGAKTFGNPPLSIGDPRVKAILAMSPVGVTASLGLNPQSFADLRVPAMFMTGSEDRGAAQNEDWQWRKTAYANAAPGDKYFVLLQGARHSTFAGTFAPVDIPQTSSIPMRNPDNPYPPGDPRNPYPDYQPSRTSGGGGPVNPQIGRGTFNDVRLISLAFWDAYLKGEARGREFLDKTAGSLGGVTIEKR